MKVYNFITHRESSVCGNCTFSTIVLSLFHCESTGLAAARILVRAFSWQMMPAFVIDNVCCSCRIRFFPLARTFFTHHDFVQNTARTVIHLVELINAAHAVVR